MPAQSTAYAELSLGLELGPGWDIGSVATGNAGDTSIAFTMGYTETLTPLYVTG